MEFYVQYGSIIDFIKGLLLVCSILVAALIIYLATIALIKVAKGEKGSGTEKSISDRIRKAYATPYWLINRFVGENIGFGKGNKWYSPKTWWGCYIEHLALLYWSIGTFVVVAFQPAEPRTETVNYLLWGIGIFIWLGVNIIMDCVSLLITKYSFGKIIGKETVQFKTQIRWLFIDIIAAGVCFLITQTVTNGIYSIQMGRPEHFFSYMFD
ncbi:hypothetical protein ACFLX6_02330, partial [Chloroflexota bacterium]